MSFTTSTSRKRTSSFSSPRPRKTLKRSESFIEAHPNPHATNQPIAIVLQPAAVADSGRSYYSEQNTKRRASFQRPTTTTTASSLLLSAYCATRKPATSPLVESFHLRAQSPAQNPRALPPINTHPRTAPDTLYKTAITTRLSRSVDGSRLLHMGPRLAMSIKEATVELERIVREQQKMDVDPSNGGMSGSWIVVPQEDWEMVDCGA